MHMLSNLPRLLPVIFIVALLSAGCAQKSVIVLLPDRDGKTGKIEVRNQGGSQRLGAPNEATMIRSSGTAPETPRMMQEDEVKKIFGEARDAMPSAPAHYILYFLSDSTKLTEESIHVFNDVVASVKKTNPAEINVVGHTDRVGAKEKNYHLGLSRAAQVKRLLILQGVDPAIIEITSHGEDNPLISTGDEIAEPENRRVEIVIR